MRHKNAVLDNLGGIVTMLGYIAILAAIIFLIVGETRNTVIEQGACNSSGTWNSTFEQCCTNASNCSDTTGANNHFSAAYLAIGETQEATSDIPGWLPIVVITLIGGLLLTLVRFFKNQ